MIEKIKMGELSFEQYDRKKEMLKKLQIKNLPKIKRTLTSLGYTIKRMKVIDDGWMDGFTIYEFTCIDRRAPPSRRDIEIKFTGDDDNTAIYEVMPSGGRSLFASNIKGAIPYRSLKEAI